MCVCVCVCVCVYSSVHVFRNINTSGKLAYTEDYICTKQF